MSWRPVGFCGAPVLGWNHLNDSSFNSDSRKQEKAGAGKGSRALKFGICGLSSKLFSSTAQTFCAGSDGPLSPRVHLQRDALILATDRPFCPPHCHIKIPGIFGSKITVQWQYCKDMGVCLTPILFVRIHQLKKLLFGPVSHRILFI